MLVKIKRLTRAVPVTIGTDTTTATAVRMNDASSAALLVGPLTASVSLSIYAATATTEPGGIFADSGAAYSLTLTAATNSSAYALPDGLFGAAVIRLVGSVPVAGTVVMKT